MAEQLDISLRQYQRHERSTSQDTFEPTILQLRQLAKLLHINFHLLVAEPTPEEIHWLQHLPKPGRPRKKTP